MLKDNIIMALVELRANRMRSFLTILGIMIGIASVIAIMTVGESINRAMSESMSDLGANNIEFYVFPKNFDGEEVTFERAMNSKDFVNEEMLDVLENRFGSRIEGISLSRDLGKTEVGLEGCSIKITISGVNALASKGLNNTIIAGRDLTSSDFSNQAKVIVISSKVADKLYGSDYSNAVGQKFECVIDNKYYDYTIVGVYEHKDSAVDFTSQSSNPCYAPLQAVLSQTNQAYEFEEFSVVCGSNENAELLMGDIKDFMNDTFYADNDTYNLDGYNMKDMIKEAENMIGTAKLAISAIAAISLLVGGIGVMNIMVVSITERTREIGTRKALGATNRSIRLQFLTESVVMCVAGGFIGVAIGVTLGIMSSKLLKFPATPPIKWIIISVLFSVAFGLFFGLYPANKAAKMNPIDALRYE